ncbi:efflux RND transporter periplasmic adaptor subunit [Gammaproteobacteria bacterium]|nr:efflux RND transporter periplasmic adaptor subunit [Gammaproteobacteria bacterium]MDC0466353.1 efflux RND transporter periplasmic adaptor subunit [Gammaproteobacteria bacterium]MDC1007684.1 efflux RND transporter periplasmic adaptor subunit [Gammaproteobacteria bacterium]MDC3216971.1 efflux RND transporter periplasmic adaptor subunit [Gammaproteobacteria bacterium]
MTKNIRISLYIFIPILLWMISGLFVKDAVKNEIPKNDLFTVGTLLSEAVSYQPTIKLKATSRSEARVDVRAKTSGEVVKIGSTQGNFVEKDSILCSLGVVELNRTEVKAPFSGFIEQIVKPGNFLERGQVCATIIQLNPIIFVAEVPEFNINKVETGQDVDIRLVTGEFINGKLTFVSKSASPSTRTFKVESQIKNKNGLVRDGITAEMTIKTKLVMAHKISPSILLLNDEGKIGIRSVENDIVKFHNITILEDSESGLWITGIPKELELIVQGQGFVEDGQKVLINKL